MSQIEELKQLAIEADSMGDQATASAAMDKIEALMAQGEPQQPEIALAETPLDIPTVSDGKITPEEYKSAISPMAGLDEAVASVVTGIPATIAGGLGGGLAAPIVGMEAAEDIVTGTQELAYQPQTEAGQESLKTVGDLMQKGLDIANYPISGLSGLADLISGEGMEQAGETIKSVQEIGLPKTAGKQVLEKTGDPLLATLTEMTPAIASSLIPIAKIVGKNIALKQKIADKIKAGSTDKTLANYMIDGAGKLKSDPLVKESVKQGFDQGVIAAVKGASKIDKSKMLAMVENMKKGKENALFAMKNRPSDIAGNSLLERVNFIKNINKSAGKQVDITAKALKGSQVDFKKPVANFMDSLDEMGIRINKNLKPIFKGSDIEGLSGPEAAIKNIVKRLSSGKRGATPDAYELHRMKRYIDEIVTYGKEGEGLKGKTERVLKSLRRDLDNTLDSNFPDYNTANTKYADTVGALDSLQDVAGKKMDLFGPNAEKATGTLLRRMMSNAQSRVNLVDAVDSLDSIAKKYGASFGDDISSQMLFVDELDGVFGTAARTSFAGETAKGVKRGAEALTGQKTATGVALEVGAAGLEKLRGINQENAFKTISELLKRDLQ